MNLRFNLTIGFLFILAGALLASDYIIQYVRNQNNKSTPQFSLDISSAEQSASINTFDEQEQEVSLPIYISVPSVGVAVDIEPGYYNFANNTWSVSDTRASFAVVTSVPSSKGGNTYIYGHNQDNIFARLNHVAVGAEAIVVNSIGKKFTYKLISMTDVWPNDVSFLNYTGKSKLTLQTCAGFWDQYRRLFFFDLESEE